MSYLAVFLLWTLSEYTMHVMVHRVPWLAQVHSHHHKFIAMNNTTWEWRNIFLWTDSWMCTLDLWIQEVIPTLIIVTLTGHWWLFGCFYIWTAFIQENVEHNPKIHVPWLSSGRWHLQHHINPKSNFGTIATFWDKLFRTEQRVTQWLM